MKVASVVNGAGSIHVECGPQIILNPFRRGRRRFGTMAAQIRSAVWSSSTSGTTILTNPVANEAMLLVGISASYAFYRWFLPMNTERRRGHLEASIRLEIAAIAIRPTSPWGTRHLARLRYLVFNSAAKSGGETQVAGNAPAALTLGHLIFRLKALSESSVTPVELATILKS